MPPPSAAPAVPLQREGDLFTPQSAAGILAMPMSRPLTPADYQPIALPVLLRRVLARRDRSGTLTIDAGTFHLDVDLGGGTAHLDRHELEALMNAFTIEHARYRLAPERHSRDKREVVPLARLALDGVRRLLRQPSLDELNAAFGERLALAPRLKADKMPLAKKMGIPQREQRFLETYVDGATDAEHLVSHGGIARMTALQLLGLLELFDVLEWTEPAARDFGEDASAELEREAGRLARSNYFDVLGVHWSAGDAELAAAYSERCQRYSPGSVNDRHNPSACRDMRGRIEVAYQALRDPHARIAYRNQELHGHDFGAIAELEQKRSESLAMRGDVSAAQRSEAIAKEISRSVDEHRAAELQRRAMRRSGSTEPKKQ